jgi:hypothetical protein
MLKHKDTTSQYFVRTVSGDAKDNMHMVALVKA